ncbi:RNA-binding protein 34 isoform 2-T2 [Rhinophrynus dorsalis]
MEVKMAKEKSKSKKEKKLNKEAKITSESQIHKVQAVPESYVAGEIAGSLFSKKSGQSVTPLSTLFETKASAVQPVYVPVVISKTKRKLPEVDGKSANQTVGHANKDAAKKPKVTKQKELSVAERKVADRESALTNADDEENAKQNIAKEKLKSKKNTNNEDESLVPHPGKRKINKAVERIKNKRTVFVGNLPADYTKQMLKNFFKEFGPIESMRFRSVARAEANLSRKVATIQRKVHPKRKNINAYVVFKDEGSATKALERNGAEVVSGFHIRVDIASKSTSHDNKRSAFVGNLPYEIEEETVREHFSDCGNVEAVRIIRDRNTGIGKGFGYVLFENTDAVQLALKLNNSELLGRKLRVKHCVTEASSKGTNKTHFKHKLDTLKQAKPQKNSTFAGETADVKKSKNKRPKKNEVKKGKNKGNNKIANKPTGGKKKIDIKKKSKN